MRLLHTQLYIYIYKRILKFKENEGRKIKDGIIYSFLKTLLGNICCHPTGTAEIG